MLRPLLPQLRVFLEQLFQAPVGVDHHGPELEAGELPAGGHDPPVAEQNRAPAVKLDEEGDEQEQRRTEDQHQQGEDHVETPLPLGVRVEAEHKHLAQRLDLRMVQAEDVDVGHEEDLRAEVAALLQDLEDLALRPHGQGDVDVVDIVVLEKGPHLVGAADQRLVEAGQPLLAFKLVVEEADHVNPGPGDAFDAAGRAHAQVAGADDHRMPDVLAPGPVDVEDLAHQQVSEEDEEGRGHRPDDEHHPRIGLGDLEQEEVGEQHGDDHRPGLEDHQEFAVVLPPPPGAVELEGVEADEAGSQHDPLEAGVIGAPRHLVEPDAQPEEQADQAAVDQMEDAINERAALAQVPGKKRRHGGDGSDGQSHQSGCRLSDRASRRGSRWARRPSR